MKVLNVLLVGIALLVGTTNLSAQEKVKKTAKERAEMHTEKMTKELNLTPDQKTKVSELNLGVEMKNEAIHSDKNMSEETKKASLHGNNDAKMAQLKTILTEEQYKKVLTQHAEMKAKKMESKSTNEKIAPSNKSVEIKELK
jgi:Spy/CpxP family protein refolding chaperone